MNQLHKTTDQELKDAFLNKAVNQLVGSDKPNQSDSAQAARDDLKHFLSGMVIFHHVGKK